MVGGGIKHFIFWVQNKLAVQFIFGSPFIYFCGPPKNGGPIILLFFRSKKIGVSNFLGEVKKMGSNYFIFGLQKIGVQFFYFFVGPKKMGVQFYLGAQKKLGLQFTLGVQKNLGTIILFLGSNFYIWAPNKIGSNFLFWSPKKFGVHLFLYFGRFKKIWVHFFAGGPIFYFWGPKKWVHFLGGSKHILGLFFVGYNFYFRGPKKWGPIFFIFGKGVQKHFGVQFFF